MRLIFIASVTLLVAGPLAAAAQQATTFTPLRTDVPLSLSGCAPVGEASLGHSPAPSGAAKAARPTHQARVKLLNHAGPGVPITGRFVPTTDIAAQAGSLDQVFTARAIAVGDQNRSEAPPHRAAAPHAIAPPTAHVACPSR